MLFIYDKLSELNNSLKIKEIHFQKSNAIMKGLGINLISISVHFCSQAYTFSQKNYSAKGYEYLISNIFNKTKRALSNLFSWTLKKQLLIVQHIDLSFTTSNFNPGSATF